MILTATITKSLGDFKPFQTPSKSIEQINVWMRHNFLQLSKTEYILYMDIKRKDQDSAQLQLVQLETNEQAWNLGEVIDPINL